MVSRYKKNEKSENGYHSACEMNGRSLTRYLHLQRMPATLFGCMPVAMITHTQRLHELDSVNDNMLSLVSL